MKTPWINYKKMQEIASTQKNCIHSAQIHIKSLSQERGIRQINIINSSEVRIQFMPPGFKWRDIEDSMNGNEGIN